MPATKITWKTVEVPRAESIDRAYATQPYTLPHSPRLIRTGKDFYDSLKIAAEMAVKEYPNLRLSTIADEQHIYAQKSPGAIKLKDVEEFRDYFGDNVENWFAWSHTLTGLRVPERYVGKTCSIGEKIPVQVIVTDISPYLSQIADPNFTRENWKDIIDKINKKEGELPVPYSRGQVIREIDPVFGVFTEIESSTAHDAPYALHAWLRENLSVPRDPISGHFDLEVARRSVWLADRRDCLGVDANYRRSDAHSAGGFRPVLGLAPKILKELARINVSEVEEAFLERMRIDYRKMPFLEFREKYKL